MRRIAVAAVAAFVVSGCVSLFPKEPPAQLYRFGADLPAIERSPADVASSFAIEVMPIDFSSAAAGSQILTTEGNEAAYIKGGRWVSGAKSLFEQALANAFDADRGPARLMALGEAVKPDYYLKLDVRTFETRYANGPKSAPTVRIVVYAALSAPGAAKVTAERLFSTEAPAEADRGSAIATAYNQAVDRVLQNLVKWADARGAD
ncbi:MAG TPA: ABC-type transport auxiliary lipoprotein family protein [Caulobacteraceae bacterium]|jgi:cholesterol transport system auxiliary component